MIENILDQLRCKRLATRRSILGHDVSQAAHKSLDVNVASDTFFDLYMLLGHLFESIDFENKLILKLRIKIVRKIIASHICK